ncbi:MAG: hypothetical protein JWQ27_3228 [Ferruginibacter sp.]|nr:hypothetical protein [Ferruginibacter sp.]
MSRDFRYVNFYNIRISLYTARPAYYRNNNMQPASYMCIMFSLFPSKVKPFSNTANKNFCEPLMLQTKKPLQGTEAAYTIACH